MSATQYNLTYLSFTLRSTVLFYFVWQNMSLGKCVLYVI